MKLIRKMIAGTFVFVLLVLVIPIFLFLSISRTYFSSSFIVNTFIPESYEYVIPTAVSLAVQKAEQSEEFGVKLEGTLRKYLTKEEYVNLLSKIFESFASQLDSYVDGGTEISLVESKKEFMGFVSRTLVKVPACKSVAEFQNATGIPDCLPPGTDGEMLAREITDQIDLKVPSRITVPEDERFENARFVAMSIAYKKYIELALVTIPVILLGLAALFVWSPLSSVLKWVGWTILLSAANASIIPILYVSAIDLIKKTQEISPEVESAIRMLLSFPEKWSWNVLMGMTVTGIVCVILSIKFRKK